MSTKELSRLEVMQQLAEKRMSQKEDGRNPEYCHTRTRRTCGVDSTGLKIYGEGEWKVRMHSVSKRRTPVRCKAFGNLL